MFDNMYSRCWDVFVSYLFKELLVFLLLQKEVEEDCVFIYFENIKVFLLWCYGDLLYNMCLKGIIYVNNFVIIYKEFNICV